MGIGLLLSVMMQAATVSSTSGHHDQDIHDGKVVLNGEGGHVTFTLSGMDIDYKKRFGAWNIDAYDLGTVGWKSSQYVTLSWDVDPNYSIVVTNISFWMRAYTSADWYEEEGEVVFNGKTKSAGSIWVVEYESEGATFSESNASGFASGIQIECRNALKKLVAIGYSYDYMMKNLSIEYTATPIIKTKTGSVPVTICPENTTTLDLNTCITNKQAHLNYHYSVTGANAAFATIDGSSFSATKVGTYSIHVTVDAKDGCHEGASADFTVNVQPAALTLTPPTASDIYYPNTLGTSVLTGGLATVGACEVDGTWAWQTPSIVPNIGDDQPFNVVFTPTTNPSYYTNFVTEALVDVKRAQYIYDGSGDGVGDAEFLKWEKADNWLLDETPDIYGEAFIRHDVVISEKVSAYSMTIENESKVTVAPTGCLVIGAGGIIGATTENFKLEAASDGVNKGQTGSLMIDPAYTGAMPSATVELYSKAYFDMEAEERNNVGSYQYVGCPLAAGTAAKSVFTQSWVYSWYESLGEWKNERKKLTLQPFVGYATSQYWDPNGLLIEQKGQLATKDNVDLPLTYTESSAEKGVNVLANSYTAPIDITKFEDPDFSDGVEATIYLFNTGSKNDVAAHEGDMNGDAAGQYIAIPIHSAGAMSGAFQLPTVIPSMQGFYVKTNKNGTLKLNYQRLVWNGSHANTPLRAQAVEPVTLCVSLSADGWSDKLYLLEDATYDATYENGYDARKMMRGNLNVFAIEETDTIAVDATNSIIGTRVGVRTGEETAYTFSFSHVGADEWALEDRETGMRTDISEGAQYTFFAAPNAVLADRFRIVDRVAPTIPTGLQEKKVEVKAQKFIRNGKLMILNKGVLYDGMGHVVTNER